MLKFGICCSLVGLIALAPAAHADVAAFGDYRKGPSVWSLNFSPDEQWGSGEWSSGPRGDSDDYTAHTDQPREVSQGAEAPPESEKPTDDEGDDDAPEGDAKSNHGGTPFFDDLIIVDVGPLLPDDLKDAPAVRVTPDVIHFTPTESPVVILDPENLPTPGAFVVLGLAAIAAGNRRRR